MTIDHMMRDEAKKSVMFKIQKTLLDMVVEEDDGKVVKLFAGGSSWRHFYGALNIDFFAYTIQDPRARSIHISCLNHSELGDFRFSFTNAMASGQTFECQTAKDMISAMKHSYFDFFYKGKGLSEQFDLLFMID